MVNSFASGSNILENMLERIEKYTKNLEGLVDERTHQLNTEKRKTEKLLHRMLPKYVNYPSPILRMVTAVVEEF